MPIHKKIRTFWPTVGIGELAKKYGVIKLWSFEITFVYCPSRTYQRILNSFPNLKIGNWNFWFSHGWMRTVTPTPDLIDFNYREKEFLKWPKKAL